MENLLKDLVDQIYWVNQVLLLLAPSTSFSKEKMYNRCQRGDLLSAALLGLHFKKFTDNVNVGNSIMTELTEWSDKDDKKPSTSLLNFFQQYHKYSEKTLTGDYGKTAQFWMSYCKLAELFLIMHCAVNINDTDLCTYSLFELARSFFIVKQLKYAGSMTFYAIELVNLKSGKLNL